MKFEGTWRYKEAEGECEGRQSTWDAAGQQAVSTWAFAREQQGIRHVW